MEKVKDKASILISEDGFYEYEITAIEALSFTLKQNIQAELVVYLKGTLKTAVDVCLESNSKLNLLYVNDCVESDLKVSVHQDEASVLKVGFYELNENRAKLEAKVHLDAPYAHCEMISSSISSDKKSFAFECIHHQPHTFSDMKNFEISKEHADYKITACGTIEKGAYQSKSHQMTRILTTSPNQRSEAIPILLIDENDVEASHANSMGKMDEAYLYYLQSRGLREAQAKELLTLSYLLPISEVIEDEKTKEAFVAQIRSRVGL